ncbi:MAG: nucleotidyltransferase domain-containing protein [Candidatus Woesearchaeota archaeon]
MSVPLYKNTVFLSKVNKFYREHYSRIVDILLFGSILKGKESPKDVDILVIYKDQDDLNLNYELKKTMSDWNVEVTSRTYFSLFEPSFIAREAFLEGYSLIRKGGIAEGLGFQEIILFKYSLEGLSKSNRVRFYYSLNGRTKTDKGMVQRFKLIKVADQVLGVGKENLQEVKDYLKTWNLSYVEIPTFMPLRIIQSRVLEES